MRKTRLRYAVRTYAWLPFLIGAIWLLVMVLVWTRTTLATLMGTAIRTLPMLP